MSAEPGPTINGETALERLDKPCQIPPWVAVTIRDAQRRAARTGDTIFVWQVGDTISAATDYFKIGNGNLHWTVQPDGQVHEFATTKTSRHVPPELLEGR